MGSAKRRKSTDRILIIPIIQRETKKDLPQRTSLFHKILRFLREKIRHQSASWKAVFTAS